MCKFKTKNDIRVMILTVVLASCQAAVLRAGTIVVGDDVNTFSSSVAGTNEQTFALNVAGLLTTGHATKKLLLVESGTDAERDFAPGVLSALTSAGYSITETLNDATSLSGFDAVFVAQSFPAIGFVSNSSLINFANNGGGVYIVGGVGPDAATEAAGWSTFLNNYGLALANTYNGFPNIPTTAQIVETFQGQNVFAIVNVPSASATPEPRTLGLLLGAVIAGFAARRFALL
jgi:hypothetical protein